MKLFFFHWNDVFDRKRDKKDRLYCKPIFFICYKEILILPAEGEGCRIQRVNLGGVDLDVVTVCPFLEGFKEILPEFFRKFHVATFQTIGENGLGMNHHTEDTSGCKILQLLGEFLDNLIGDESVVLIDTGLLSGDLVESLSEGFTRTYYIGSEALPSIFRFGLVAIRPLASPSMV